MDRFLKICLVLIVVLLAVIALRLIVSLQSVHAQAQYKYLAVRAYGENASPGNRIQDVLDKYAADGWELAAPVYAGEGIGGPDMYLIFRK